MSLALKPREKVTTGLRRLARRELREARRALVQASPPPPAAVHDARRSLKKVRAIIRLLDADHGRGLVGARKRVRKTARTLSRVRDADAMGETVEKLRRREPRLFSAPWLTQLRTWMTAHRRTVRGAADRKHTWTSLEEELRVLRRKSKCWRRAHRGFGALSRGIAVSHRRGKKAMTQATTRHGATDFHRWRKQIKTLWYELRLFASAGPQVSRDIRALQRAGDALGDNHNVVVLCAAIAKHRAGAGTPLDPTPLTTAADRYHANARKKAIAAVRHIYRRRSRAYVGELKRAWKRWRRGPSGAARRT